MSPIPKFSPQYLENIGQVVFWRIIQKKGMNDEFLPFLQPLSNKKIITCGHLRNKGNPTC